MLPDLQPEGWLRNQTTIWSSSPFDRGYTTNDEALQLKKIELLRITAFREASGVSVLLNIRSFIFIHSQKEKEALNS